MRRVGVKRSNSESMSYYQDHLSTFQPHPKKPRVVESSSDRHTVSRVISWCWSSLRGLWASLFPSGEHDTMLQRDDGEVEDDDSYASCVEETNSDLYEQTTDTNTDSSGHLRGNRTNLKDELFSPISLSTTLDQAPQTNMVHSTRSSFLSPTHRSSVQTSTPLSHPQRCRSEISTHISRSLRSANPRPTHTTRTSLRSTLPTSMKPAIPRPNNATCLRPSNTTSLRPTHPYSLRPSNTTSLRPTHPYSLRPNNTSFVSTDPRPVNRPVHVSKPATSMSFDFFTSIHHPEEIGPISRQTSQPRATTPISPIDKEPGIRSQQQQSKINVLSQWIQELKTHQRDSSQDRQVLVDIAEKKLQMQRKERRSLEDARVTRLRALLGDVSLTNAPVREVSLSLTAKQIEKATIATRGGPGSQCLSERYNISITSTDLCTLTGLHWLNDNVVNFYFNMIRDRFEKVHVMSSFFYPKLSQSGYSSIRRWTKKVDLFAMELILLPIHLGMHWCLAVIDFRTKSFSYFDSLRGNNPACLRRLREYLGNESMDKKKMAYDLTGWSDNVPKDIPLQENGSDCGVFMCMYARHIAAGVPFQFSQVDMPQLRTHMICEIIDQKLFQ